MEDVFPLTYLQGVSITVHMDERDDVFVRRDKMYVADFLEWIVDKEDRVPCTRNAHGAKPDDHSTSLETTYV
jgi:hypothetical protein